MQFKDAQQYYYIRSLAEEWLNREIDYILFDSEGIIRAYREGYEQALYDNSSSITEYQRFLRET